MKKRSSPLRSFGPAVREGLEPTLGNRLINYLREGLDQEQREKKQRRHSTIGSSTVFVTGRSNSSCTSTVRMVMPSTRPFETCPKRVAPRVAATQSPSSRRPSRRATFPIPQPECPRGLHTARVRRRLDLVGDAEELDLRSKLRRRSCMQSHRRTAACCA